MTARWVMILGGIGLFLAGMALFASAPEQERTEVAAAGIARRDVGTLQLRSEAIRPRARFSGVLEARRTVKLFAETPGPVLVVGAEALDRVDANQILVQIDPVLAQIDVEKALAALTRARSELDLAESNLARRQELAARKVLSDSVLDDAVSRERVARASLREAKARLRQAREDLDNKTLRAPFAGEVRSFPVEVGEYVAVGQQLAELVDLSTARITVGVADREVVAIQPGQRVELEVEARAPERFEGRVLRVGASADPETRRFPVEIEAPNDAGRLLPGMVATASLDLGEPVARTLIPREATVDEFGLRFAYVVEEGGPDGPVVRQRRLVLRPVPFRPSQFEVVDGLVAGDRVAVTDVRQLRDGEPIRAIATDVVEATTEIPEPAQESASPAGEGNAAPASPAVGEAPRPGEGAS